jgi:UDP-glucose 6-dehydrogenase
MAVGSRTHDRSWFCASISLVKKGLIKYFSNNFVMEKISTKNTMSPDQRSPHYDYVMINVVKSPRIGKHSKSNHTKDFVYRSGRNNFYR